MKSHDTSEQQPRGLLQRQGAQPGQGEHRLGQPGRPAVGARGLPPNCVGHGLPDPDQGRQVVWKGGVLHGHLSLCRPGHTPLQGSYSMDIFE